MSNAENHQFKDITERGKYLYLGKMAKSFSIICDCCNRSNLIACITLNEQHDQNRKDLCLPCTERIVNQYTCVQNQSTLKQSNSMPMTKMMSNFSSLNPPSSTSTSLSPQGDNNHSYPRLSQDENQDENYVHQYQTRMMSNFSSPKVSQRGYNSYRRRNH